MSLSVLDPFASKYFKDSLSLFSFGSTIVISLHFLTFDKINPQSKPMAPAPITIALLLSRFLESSFSPS
jgi:hypothetical protein